MTLFSKETKENVAFEIDEFLEDWPAYVFFGLLWIVSVLALSYTIFSGLATMGVVMPYWLVIFTIIVVVLGLAALLLFVLDSLPCCEL